MSEWFVFCKGNLSGHQTAIYGSENWLNSAKKSKKNAKTTALTFFKSDLDWTNFYKILWRI